MTRTAVSVALISLAMGTGGSHKTHRLEVVSDGRAVWSGPIGEGEAFSLTYTHSRELSRWVQHYAAQGGNLRQAGSAFAAYGAGMPLGQAPAARTAEGFSVPQNQVLDELRMMNWRGASIELLYRGQELNVSSWFDDFDSFSVRVR